jgi:hypothetical protein
MQHSPGKSTRRASRELGISRCSIKKFSIVIWNCPHTKFLYCMNFPNMTRKEGFNLQHVQKMKLQCSKTNCFPMRPIFIRMRLLINRMHVFWQQNIHTTFMIEDAMERIVNHSGSHFQSPIFFNETVNYQ